MSLYRGYQGARSCTKGPTPGAQALMSWFLGAYRGQGGVNTGIFLCRNVRGGSTTSLHGEGRACDLGIRPYSAGYGTALADKLRLHSGELGIQLVIWNRRIWSGSRPDAGFRPYSGVSPHTDHIHAELSWDAARTLTVARIQQVLGGGGGGAATPSAGSSGLLRRGSKGDAVRRVQNALRTKYRSYAGHIAVDGDFGPATEAAVKEFQRRSRLAVDGIVGPATSRALGL